MTPSPGSRGSGTEVWLVRVGTRAQLARRRAAFALSPADLVLAPPGGEELEWARSLAQGRDALEDRALRAAESDEAPAEVAARAWRACEAALSGDVARLWVVLSEPVLQLVVARALDFPLARAGALRVDPGNAVLLRDDPIGIVLRYSNVSAPPARSGSALPGATGEAAR